LAATYSPKTRLTSQGEHAHIKPPPQVLTRQLGGFLLLMQEQEKETKLLEGMFLTFATLIYFSEFLQKSYPPFPISSFFSLFFSSSITL